MDYHFTNLWFAANQSNWPLAQFYFNETRSHLRWAVRIIPVRKDNAGKEVKLQDILQSLENAPLKQLEEAVTLPASLIVGALYQVFGPLVAFGFGAGMALAAAILLMGVAESHNAKHV